MKQEQPEDGYAIRIIVRPSQKGSKETTMMVDGFQLRSALLGKEPLKSTIKENLFSALKEVVKEADKPTIILASSTQ